jgi:hypothetical protein
MESMEFGRFDIDFSTYWEDGPIAPVRSTSRLSNTPDPLTEVLGIIIGQDTVAILLNPHFTHGGVTLGGYFQDSAITGYWSVRGDQTGTGGRFRMRRQHRD